MLRSKLSRHTFSFLVIVIGSFGLYPAAQGENDLFVWALLIFIGAAAILTILKER